MKLSRADLADFGYFLVVAEHLNFRRAAVALGVSASAISHAINGLERRTGVRLFNRTNRSVTLTSAGETLREAIAPHFEAIDAASDILNRYRDTPTGHVRLNVLASAAENLLAPVLPVFIERYPAISLELSISNRMVDVVGEGFDAGIRFGGTVPADMIARRLSPDAPWVVVGAPGYLKRFGIPGHPDDLMHHRCIQIRLGNDQLYLWEFDREGETLSIAAPGPIIVDEGKIALDLALKGAGLMYVTRWNVEKHLVNGELVSVLDGWISDGGGFYIYYSSRRQVPTGMRLLIDLIKEMAPLGQ